MSTEPATGDGSAVDSAAGDTEVRRGANDAGANDAGATDAGATDAGANDAGATDAGATDGGATDGGATGAADGGGWAPEACTLPTAERPLRAADFDAVFAATVRGLDRIGPTRLRLDLEPSPQAAARMAELAAAETGCCSFFTFALTATGGALTLDITVPQQYAPVLAALADRAVAVAGRAS